MCRVYIPSLFLKVVITILFLHDTLRVVEFKYVAKLDGIAAAHREHQLTIADTNRHVDTAQIVVIVRTTAHNSDARSHGNGHEQTCQIVCFHK